jgi:hypothetical protein
MAVPAAGHADPDVPLVTIDGKKFTLELSIKFSKSFCEAPFPISKIRIAGKMIRSKSKALSFLSFF